MKKFILLLVPWLFIQPCWADQRLEAVWQTINIMDWMQTRYIATHSEDFYETNKILGEHPDLRDVNKYFIEYAAFHYLMSRYLPGNLATAWQITTTFDSGIAVLNNHSIGIKFNMRF